jgi:hypothetical protein
VSQDHWLPGFNFNVEEWDAKGQTDESLAICRTLEPARATFAAAVAEKPAGRFMIPEQDACGEAAPGGKIGENQSGPRDRPLTKNEVNESPAKNPEAKQDHLEQDARGEAAPGRRLEAVRGMPSWASRAIPRRG